MPILQVSMAFLICVVITYLRNLTSGIYMYPYKSMDRAERIFVEPYYRFDHRNYDALVPVGANMMCVLATVCFRLDIYRPIRTS